MFKFLFMILFSVTSCQNLARLKPDVLDNMLLTIERLEQKLEVMDDRISTELQKAQERDTSMTSKLEELHNQMAAMEERDTLATSKLEERDTLMTSKLEELHNQMAAMEEREQQTEVILRATCSRDQVAELQELLVSELQSTNNETRHRCSSRKQLTNFQDLLTTDECAMETHNCSSNAVCVDVFAGYQCTCLKGYVGNGFSCEDIDECRTGVNGCHPDAECTNTEGNYTCKCPIGFTGNGTSCEAILCTSPWVSIPVLGCLTEVKEVMTWEAANQHCQSTLGGRLLEGIISRHQIDQLKQHFNGNQLWVGLKLLKWVSTGDPIPDSSPLWYIGYPNKGNNQCGAVSLTGSNPGLFCYSCSSSLYPLCQK